MKLNRLIATALIASVPAIGTAQAADTQSTPRVDQRQAQQSKRIEQGVKSGQLTEKETARLQKGQAHVQKAEDKAMADGLVVTALFAGHSEEQADTGAFAVENDVVLYRVMRTR